ncbi:hypothetical protein [Kribbella sp. NPDC023855]|uniref:hypothetical protein n=1 Tax=Kribbella sp. NPDC023855 TaxID=3154698 RepID=UPI0033F3F400
MHPFSVIIVDKVAKESRSGMANAPLVPERPSLLRRWQQSRHQATLCKAEPRDRSTPIAGPAGAC